MTPHNGEEEVEKGLVSEEDRRMEMEEWLESEGVVKGQTPCGHFGWWGMTDPDYTHKHNLSEGWHGSADTGRMF